MKAEPNNFQRQSWFAFGAVPSVVLTSLGGWPVGLGWLIGGVFLPWLAYAFLCGYVRVGKRA